MTSKLKLMLIATIAAVSIASPALAQSTTQNGGVNTHQARSLRSEQIRGPAGSSDVYTPTYVPGFGNDNVPSGAE
jgi:CDP-diacylglycerol pyrophosphatase